MSDQMGPSVDRVLVQGVAGETVLPTLAAALAQG